MASWIWTTLIVIVAVGIALASMQWSGYARRRTTHPTPTATDDYAEILMQQHRITGPWRPF